MTDIKETTALQDMLDEYLQGEYRRNQALVVGLSTVIFIGHWIMAAFILFILVNMFTAIGLKDFLLECQTSYDVISNTETTKCTNKAWISVLVNIASFIIAAGYLTTPRPTIKF